ncbi:oligosaccharide flippase family protein [Mycobacterium sp. 236(2023)]|uniref:lipopolysaccharide biosynthesis protein n=1 Tax=Mycobacterium sp. 236(2023) TaxID=3038163 RepID=UPI00241514D1|nr:oligosaccharide flippase family protein [Mycobacterium sp. 236(2023)]MDG4665377.1 oligosaccharide flippase family protein [Mycobacterium sp. 236(2023)]
MAPNFARNTLLGFVSGAAVTFSGFVGSAIAARLLGPDDFGVVAYVVWCVTIAAAVANLGSDVVQQRFLPNLRAAGKSDQVDGLVGAIMRLAMGAAVVVGVVLFAYLYGPGTGALSAGSPHSQIVVIAVALVWFFCWRMGDLYLFNLRGEQRFDTLARVSTVSALMRVATTVLGAWLFGIPGALAGYIAATVLPASRLFPLLRLKPRVDRSLRREVIGFALMSWTIGVIGNLLFGRTQIIFLEHYTDIGTVGLFAVALTVAEMAAQLPPLLLSALLPRFSEQSGQGAHDNMKSLYRTMTAFIAVVMLPFCLGLAAVTPVLVPLIFGTDFADAAAVSSILLIAIAINSLGGANLSLILSKGKNSILWISNAVGLVGVIGLGFLLIPHYGLIGAAWSRAIIQVVVILIEIICATIQLGFAMPYRALGAIALAAVAQGAVAYAIVLNLGGAGSLVLAIPAAILTYLIAVRLLGVIPLVDPELSGRLISHTPGRFKPLASRIMRLLAPSTTGRAEQD